MCSMDKVLFLNGIRVVKGGLKEPEIVPLPL
jgi:hypothetical protein